MIDERTPSLAELAARVLRKAETTIEASDDRAAHLALLAATIREERAGASRRKWLVASLALAAALAAAFGLRGLLSDTSTRVVATAAGTKYDVHVDGAAAEVVRRSAEAPPSKASAPSGLIHPGDRVRAPAAGVSVLVATGTKLTLDPGADVAVAEEGPTQIFALGAGSMRIDVAKLHDGERFLVRTTDTEVEVRGTSFRVERIDSPSACMPELRTRVLVFEGLVVARHAGVEARVAAGEAWPPPCVASPGDSAHAPVPPPTTTPPGPVTPSAPPSAGVTSSGTPPAATASKLTAANELFGKAEAARKSGDARGSVALFDRLLAEYPSSPLVEHATVERMRALDPIDRNRAVAAAREYLARFPLGFARAEAEAIVAISP